MVLNALGKKFIHNEEGLVLMAYLCPANVWTIGFGNRYHLDDTPVTKGDKITLAEANNLKFQLQKINLMRSPRSVTTSELQVFLVQRC
nr:hypothetical protein [Pedobacter sp. BMA]